MKTYAAYLFDLDGTLVDTAPDINAALNHALTTHGCKGVEEAHTRHCVGHGAKALVNGAIRDQGLDPDLETPLLDAFIDFYSENLSGLSEPYPGVLDALGQLQARGAGLAVVTNKLARFTEPLLKELNLTGWFQAIVCGDTTANAKPAADPAFEACKRLGTAPEASLFVGDSAADVGCARAAGCPVVVVRDGYNHGIAPDELGADRVIESFLDLV
ncbi:MAG: HAD family hydrolase [Pseudomonadota bacterium]